LLSHAKASLRVWLADACEDAGIHFVLAHAYYVKSIAGNPRAKQITTKGSGSP
jgi:hypothetical protein